jgi:hypothetical protein
VPTPKGVVIPAPKGVVVPSPKEVIVPTPEVISSLYARHMLTLSRILWLLPR